jgi:hypothetical protein
MLRKIITWAIFLSLFIYVIIRAWQVSFTHDECLSFNIVLGDVNLGKTANNHFLNTWLMFVCYKMFGAQEFVLRLPNILAFIIYLFFSYRILNQSKDIILLFIGISLLLLNPYLLDFFSLARGYGLSLAFGLAALYYLLQSEDKNTYKQFVTNLALASLFSLLAAYSNLVLINLNLSIMLVFFIAWCVLIKRNITKINLSSKLLPLLIFIINAVLLLPLINQLDTLKNNKELYFGGQKGFIADTLKTLIHNSLYFSNYNKLFEVVIKWSVITLFAIVCIYQVYHKKYAALSKITIILTLMICASVIQHYAFDALYPIARTSLIFLPLFAVFVYLFIRDMVLKSNLKLYKKSVCILSLIFICFPLGLNFLKNLNLKHTLEWDYEANTKLAMQEIVKQHKISTLTNKNCTISNTWIYEPAINYYRKLYEMNYLQVANRSGVNNNTDFIYCTAEEKEHLTIKDMVILKYFDDTKTVLLKTK